MIILISLEIVLKDSSKEHSKIQGESLSHICFLPSIFLLFLAATLPVNLYSEALNQQGCDLLNPAMSQVEKIRGLAFKHPVDCRALSRADFNKLSNEYLFELISLEDFLFQGQLYKGLGLIPEEYDYERCYLENSNDQTEAFYHIFRKEIIIPSDVPVSLNLMAHELVHALQDQHFNLSKLAKQAVHSTDASLGLGALIEGDAMKVQSMVEQGMHDRSISQVELPGSDRKGCVLPAALQSLFYFPYSFGQLFVDRLFAEEKNFKGVDRAFISPPLSSTEILHKDAYRNFLKSRPVKFVSVLKKMLGIDLPLKPLFRDSIGQYGIRLILGNYLPTQHAILGGKGWQGDEARLFQVGQKRMIQWVSEWSSEAEASEFYVGFMSSLAQRSGGTFYLESNRILSRLPGGQTFYLERKSVQVLFELLDESPFGPITY